MGGSIPLFRVRGISIRMHLTFPLILVWGAVQFGWLNGGGLSGALFGVVVTLILFTIVVLHELGHSFAALYYGVPVKQIILMPLGGVAQLSRIPEEPRQEFVIAIAGPAVNFLLAILLWLLALVFGASLTVSPEILTSVSFSSLFSYIFLANLSLGIFNLLPAFPMDGGRILRAPPGHPAKLRSRHPDCRRHRSRLCRADGALGLFRGWLPDYSGRHFRLYGRRPGKSSCAGASGSGQFDRRPGFLAAGSDIGTRRHLARCSAVNPKQFSGRFPHLRWQPTGWRFDPGAAAGRPRSTWS